MCLCISSMVVLPRAHWEYYDVPPKSGLNKQCGDLYKRNEIVRSSEGWRSTAYWGDYSDDDNKMSMNQGTVGCMGTASPPRPFWSHLGDWKYDWVCILKSTKVRSISHQGNGENLSSEHERVSLNTCIVTVAAMHPCHYCGRWAIIVVVVLDSFSSTANWFGVQLPLRFITFLDLCWFCWLYHIVTFVETLLH